MSAYLAPSHGKRRHQLGLPIALVLLSLVVSACGAPCRTVCRKTLRCGVDSERVSQEECESSCNRQLSLYQQWEDKEKITAFRQHRNCIFNSSCEEIADGVCYDELLFEFDEDQSPIDPNG